MDHQCIQRNKYKMANDWQLDKQHFDHKYQGKDLDIYSKYKQDLMDNQNWEHIQVYILRKDFQYIHQHMNMHQHRFVLCR